MRYFLCTLALLLCSLSALAQNNHAPTRVGGTPNIFQDTTYFRTSQNRFYLGWHWGGNAPGWQINKRMNINTIHGKYKGASENDPSWRVYPDSTDISLLLTQDTVLGVRNNNGYREYIAAVYDACQPGGNYSDSTRWVYGFGSRSGTWRDSTLGVVRRQVFVATADSGQIMHNVSPRSILVWNYPRKNDTNMAGGRYYLSINLRRMDANDNAMNNDTVLKVKLKYKVQDINESRIFSIMFEQVSDTGSTILPNRGGALSGRLVAAPSKPRELVITRNMLPAGNSSNRDITLHAYFRADSLVTGINLSQKIANADSIYSNHINHPMQWIIETGDMDLENYQITDMDVEISYMGKSTVGINYVRIATPLTRQLAEGHLDTTILAKIDSAKANINEARNTLATNGRPNTTLKISSFYGYDEPEERHWYAQRLLHYLLDGKLSVENDKFDNQDVKAYTEGTRIRAPWKGSTRLLGTFGVKVAAPYMVYGSNIAKTFALQRGRLIKRGYDSSLYRSSTDKRGSQYEELVFTSNWKSLVDSSVAADLRATNDSIAYNENLKDGNYLATSEVKRYENYVLNNSYLYDTTKPWHCNIWLLSEGWSIFRNGDSIKVLTHRPPTGEEVRADIWNVLIMGAKGIFYDRMYTIPNLTREKTNNEHPDTIDYIGNLMPGRNYGGYQLGAITGRTDNPTCTVQANLLLCEDFGGDYIVRDTIIGGNRIVRDSTYFDKYTNLDTVANAMGVAPDKIYLGRKSKRLEVAKINARIAQMSDTLMQMRLVAWHGKGVRTLRNGDTTKLDSILSMNKISTLRKHNVYGGQYPSQPEKAWEQFYDITLHRLANKPMDSAFVVGVMNRRTNPLLGKEGETGADSIRFISTADFDAMVDSNASQYYAQGGARSITLPFTYSPEVNGQRRSVLLHIREMGCVAGKPCVDTVISGTRDLTVHLQPGEGKLLYVQVLGYDTKEIIGDLRYTNQRKIVAEPRGSDSVVYHAVYQREVEDPYPHTQVFYRRSVPTHISKPHASGIEWEPFEAQLSDTVKSLLTFVYKLLPQERIAPCSLRTTEIVPDLPCGYPSIVVHNGTVRVVFSCLDFELFPRYIEDANWVMGHYSQYYDPCDTVLNSVVVMESVFPSDAQPVFYMQQGNVRGEKRYATTPWMWSSPNGFKLLHPSDPYRTRPRYDLAQWGTPMIGATSDGSIYYTWSDSLTGIGVSAGNWDSSAITHLKHSFGLAKHPSLPSYVAEAPAGREMSVVWQETNPFSQLNHIFYAHVQKDDTGKVTVKPLPTHVTGQMNYTTFPNLYPIDWGINSDSTIIRLSDDTCKVNNTHPTVIRALEEGSDTVGVDIIAWTAKSDYGKKNVMQRSIAYSDYVFSRGAYTFLPWLDIGPRRTYLGKDDQSEGVNLTNGTGIGNITTNSSTFVHFSQTVTSTRVRFPSNTKAYTIGLRENNTMWQIEYPYHSLLFRLEGDEPYIGLDNLPSPRKTVERGFNNNLSASPERNTPYSIGRRLYNKDEINIVNNSIYSSAQYFLRNTFTDPIAIPVAELRVIKPIGRCEWTRVLITLNKSSDSLLLAMVTDAKGVHTDSLSQGVLIASSDTVASLGFELEHGEEFNILSAEEGIPGIQAELVRDSDGQRFSLILEKGDANSYIQNTYISYLRTDTYHLEFFAQEGKVVPSEAIELEGVQLANGSTFPIGLYKGSESGGNNPRQILLPSDGSGAVHELQTYPNPTNELLYFTVREDYRGGKYRLLNSLGVTVLQGEVVPGTSAQQLSVREIPSGVYYLQIEATNKSGTVPLRSKVIVRK